MVVVKENNLFGFRIQYSKPVVVTDVDQGQCSRGVGMKVKVVRLKGGFWGFTPRGDPRGRAPWWR